MASYHDELEALAQSIGSDGCTHALQVHVECCWEHDWAYVTGTTPRGVPCTKAQADQRFRDCCAAHSPLRRFSPWAWLRWLAVSRFGRGNWTKATMAPRLYRPVMASTALAQAQAARDAIVEELMR
jgi:hypothetical protein